MSAAGIRTQTRGFWAGAGGGGRSLASMGLEASGSSTPRIRSRSLIGSPAEAPASEAAEGGIVSPSAWGLCPFLRAI